jgi:hypothetical protein
MPSDAPNATSDPGFFDGRFMVEIGDWNWGLCVGLSHPSMPRKHRFQGGLMFNRSIVIEGLIRAPNIHRGRPIEVWVSPFGQEERFDARTGDVGRFWSGRLGAKGPPFEADLRLPEEALAPALTCLGSVWKLVDIWIAGEEADGARVTAYSFASNVHPNLKEWAGPELASD